MEFYEQCKEGINTFDILVQRVHDIYLNRVLFVLNSMQEISLQSLPTNELWTVQEFLEKNEDACRAAAIELNRKSQMVEEAVEEVLELVQKASVIFRNMIGPENDLFGEEEARMHSAEYQNDDPGGSNQQQDWSLLYSCFENPLSLFTSYEGGLPKGMQDMVRRCFSITLSICLHQSLSGV